MSRRIGLRSKLLLYGLGLGAGILLVSLLAGRWVEQQAQHGVAHRTDLLLRTEELATLAGSASEEGFSYVLVGDPQERERALSKLYALGVRVRGMSSIAAVAHIDTAHVAGVSSAADDFQQAGQAMFASFDETGAVPRVVYSAYEDALDRLVDKIAALDAAAQGQAEIDAASTRRTSNLLSLAISLAVLVLAFVCASALGRRITGPLLSLREAVLAFRQGARVVNVPDTSNDEVGDLARAFGAMATDIRSHIEAIQQAQQRLADVFASIGEIVVVCDLEGQIVAANPAACKAIGLAEDALVGRRAASIFDEETQGDASRPILVDGERLLNGFDGRAVPVRLSVSALRGPMGGSVWVALDLTEQRRMESELLQAQKLEAVGRLAAGVAHEINTPVQFVSDNIQFARDACSDLFSVLDAYRGACGVGADRQSEALAEAGRQETACDLAYVTENLPQALERSLEGLGRIATIVRSMKEFAHPDQQGVMSVDLNKLIESTLVVARHEYKYVADLVTELNELPPVECVPGEFNQALLNVVVNAAHAIADVVKGTESKGTITVRTRAEGDSAIVSISDTGHGIPEPIRDKIFDPFFTTKEVGRGTGQGLAMVRSVVVRKLGGAIRLHSEVGLGTTFDLIIPVKRAARQDAA